MWQRPLKYTAALLKLELVALVLNACIDRDNNYSELIVIVRCLTLIFPGYGLLKIELELRGTCHIALASLSIP